MSTFGKLWLEGVAVDWQGFHGGQRRNRVSLPTYPFERRRYWIDPRGDESHNSFGPTSLRKKADIADWFYISSWKRSVSSRYLQQANLSPSKSRWLVFVGESSLGARLIQHLKRDGHNVITITTGEQFARLDQSTFVINPRQTDDYYRLIAEVQLSDKDFHRIVHLFSITPDHSSLSGKEFFERAQHLGFYSLLFLVKALEQHRLTDRIQIDVVTNDVHDVSGEQTIFTENATILGACKVIPQEYPGITCRNIDIAISESADDRENDIVEHLRVELLSEPLDPIVACRSNYRWVQTFEPLRNESFSEMGEIKEGGTYLITGGMGGIGLVMAEYLARTARARLVLSGRSEFPSREEWEQWLTIHGDQDDVSRKIRKLQQCERMGAEVMPVSVDVADQQQMQELISQVYDRFGKINGVIHSAGVIGEEFALSIQEADRASCEQQFRAKVKGLYVLEEVLKGRKIDFCLLQSSLSSILGGLGYAAYSAANSFMDAFAHRMNRKSDVPWISTNWDAWQLGSRKSDVGNLGTLMAELAITSEEGVKAFEFIIPRKALGQIIVSTGDLQARVNLWLRLASSKTAGHQKQEAVSSLHSRPNLRNAYIAPDSDIERRIAEIWQEILGIEQVGIHDSFFDLGGHSLMATQLISRLRATLGADVPLRDFFATPTIKDLAAIVETALLGAADSQRLDELFDLLETIDEDEAQRMLTNDDSDFKHTQSNQVSPEFDIYPDPKRPE